MNKVERMTIKPAKKHPLTPRLRFPEFRDAGEWGLRHGGGLFDNVVSKNQKYDLPILAITQEYGAIPRSAIDYHVTVTEKSIESYKIVEVGDFIISLRSFQGGIEYSQYYGLCSPAYIVLRKKEAINDNFFKFFFKSEQLIYNLNKNIEGLRDGKMISYKQFSDQLLPYPSPKEQQKIAACLSSLDESITAETYKLDALKAHKKGLLEQLFPAEGETVPRLRFPEFQDAGEWEEKRLGKIIKIFSGDAPSSYELHATYAFPYVKVEDMNSCSKYQIKSREYVNSEAQCLPVGAVLFPKRGAAIMGNKIRIAAVPFCIDSNMMALFPKVSESLASEFLYYLIYTQELSKIADTSSIPQINNKHIEPHKVFIPSPSEQQRIVDSLSSLDELITAQSQKIDLLKAHKKGLMQQLFPTLDEVRA